jgi:dihydroorotate dehydrogenase electron transfer subunit
MCSSINVTQVAVDSNLSVSSGYRLLSVLFPPDILEPEPGQFYMMDVSEMDDPLLRRPFSVYKVELFHELAIRLSFLFKIVGKGTEMLSKCNKGDIISILGPLGNKVEISYKKPLMIAGGTGIATLNFLINGYSESGCECSLLYGANRKNEIVDIDRSGLENLHYSTIDGSFGNKGDVVQLYKDLKEKLDYDVIYACGPMQMLKSLYDEIEKPTDVPCYVSLEAYMGCGVGACMGCAVPSVDGDYIHICKDGPFISAERVLWEMID